MLVDLGGVSNRPNGLNVRHRASRLNSSHARRLVEILKSQLASQSTIEIDHTTHVREFLAVSTFASGIVGCMVVMRADQ